MIPIHGCRHWLARRPAAASVTVVVIRRLRVVSGAAPRIVNVSSGAGSYGDTAFGLRARSGAAASYGISKAALNALTVTLAAELADSGILVNAVCPGLTATWPGAESMGARPAHDSAAGVVWAATLPDGGPTGGLFRDGRPLPW
jgi:NAD(P)-dependent dehydrogenase (short-subunit alcohol dehydrogenase family)